jgi:hypothetical protein
MPCSCVCIRHSHITPPPDCNFLTLWAACCVCRRGTDVWESRMQLLVSLVRGRAHIDALAPSSEPLLTPSSPPLNSSPQQGQVGGRLRDKWRKRHPLRRIGRVLSRLTAPCNLTPSDVVTGAVLAAAAQRQRRKRALLEALQQQESMQVPAGSLLAPWSAVATQLEDVGGSQEAAAAIWEGPTTTSSPRARKQDAWTVHSSSGLPSFSAHADFLPEPPPSPFKAFSAGGPYATAAEAGASAAVGTATDVQYPAGSGDNSSREVQQLGMHRGSSTSSILKTRGHVHHSRQPSRQGVRFTIPEGSSVTAPTVSPDTDLSRDQTCQTAQPESDGLIFTNTAYHTPQQLQSSTEGAVGQSATLHTRRSGSLVSAVSRQLSWFLNSQGSWGSWASDDVTLAPGVAADSPAAPGVKEQDGVIAVPATGASHRGDDAAAAAEGTAGQFTATDPACQSPGTSAVDSFADGDRGGPGRRMEGGTQAPRSFSAAGEPSLVLPPDRQYTLMRPQVRGRGGQPYAGGQSCWCCASCCCRWDRWQLVMTTCGHGVWCVTCEGACCCILPNLKAV